MSTEIRVPQLPESVADATLVAWHKQPGDPIRRDENLADLETDKVVLEVPAPANGIVREIRVQSGAVVTSGQVLAVIEEGAAAAAAAKPAAAASPAAALKGAARSAPAEEGKDGRLSPSVRRLVEENQLNPAAIPASGRDGRLTKSDVVDYLGKKPAAGAPPAVVPAAPAPPVQTRAPKPAAPGARSEQRVAMTRLRARIAQRLLEAQASQALLTTFNEVDLTATQELRARYKERFEKVHGVKLGFMSFFVKASVHALKKYPIVNASIDGNDIVYHGYFDVGIAVGSPRGLVVPILRDCDRMSFADVEKKIADFGKRAQDGKLTIEELTGGTFSISNGGVFGSMLSTPIINPPQAAILGVHATRERPVAENGQVVIRPVNYLALSYDHRIIDGREAVLSLVAIKEALEDPARLLLDL